MDKPAIALIGAGRLGTSLILALSQKGYKITGVADSDLPSAQAAAQAVQCSISTADPAAAAKEADFIIISVPDSQIKPVAEVLAAKQAFKKGQIFCHSSGYLPASALVSLKLFGAYTISMHPFVSISRKDQPQRLAGAYFALEGDAVGLESAKEVVSALDGFPVIIKAQDKPLYHAAGAIASNLAVSLLLSARQLLQNAGISGDESEQMLAAMQERLTRNISEDGLDASLTGPIARGDADTVAGHLQALRAADPALARVYALLGAKILEACKNGMGQNPYSQLEKLLKGQN
jgi:predicted short-subunit dehydrogenase-like oxidoreductase (DUF2520 family)